ncbi:hypothetical protein T12_9145 [Trichinella patagoniensis]|uniref:Uncharacterized protein n=1 Tax=Trichinella patagoniensis TaxID=990121 RepID=A0A0V0XDN1_9BILA|nr:hypothetical protein T12_9145 [Trichinella patagoniensis]
MKFCNFREKFFSPKIKPSNLHRYVEKLKPK